MIRRRNIIEVHFDPHKYESADCTILGDFAYISYLCLLIYLWKKCIYSIKIEQIRFDTIDLNKAQALWLTLRLSSTSHDI